LKGGACRLRDGGVGVGHRVVLMGFDGRAVVPAPDPVGKVDDAVVCDRGIMLYV
jgi:hypothetical protein